MNWNSLRQWFRKAANFFFVPKLRQMYLMGIFAVLLSLMTYAWYLSFGKQNQLSITTTYYDQLATSFQHGRLWLEESPSPTLLALPYPYSHKERKDANASFPWDITFYGGRFFLYWGPVPAIVLAGVKFIFPPLIGDQYLVFAFSAGILIFSTLLIIDIWHRFFQQVPISLVLLCVLLAAFANPITYMLGRSEIYEAAITGGQFFLIGELYFTFSAIEKTPVSKRRLMLASIFLVCATGSRTTLMIPAVFLIAMTFLWIIANDKGLKKLPNSGSQLIALGLPLGLGMLGLGWYNWARFGSVLETGFRYQLTDLDLNRLYNMTFSQSYILPNLQNYLFNPLKIISAFPFIVPEKGQSLLALRAGTPNIYDAEIITGIIFSLPFVLFAIIPVASIFSSAVKRFIKKEKKASSRDDKLFLWITVCLIGTSFIPFAVLLFFFYAIMRYQADFTPSLVLLSVLGFWQAYYYLRHNSLARYLFVFFSLCLAILSITIGLLLAI